MGNVQASSIANQLLPCESYISEVSELKFICSLGSTRFIKVGKADHFDGPVVIKVFVLVDQSFPIEPYQEEILYIQKQLNKSLNCCSFTRIYITTQCAILCRTFAKYTLYDRLSSRPFLLEIEKKWIIFQLIKSFLQCHSASVCHGDIKTENILVSSSLWIQLTDFAPFKPAFLPYDNPSTFTFFFNTSRRRCCYIAPERFKKSDDINYSPRFTNDYSLISEGLTEAMDIFSIGCVIIELLTDGQHIAFSLPQVIDYKRMEEHEAKLYLTKVLNNVPEEFHSLLMTMLDQNPTQRKEGFWKFLISDLKMFPALFENYIYNYFKDLCFSLMPDEIITRLYIERVNYLPQLKLAENNDCVLLFINLVTSNLRACSSITSKMDAINLLQEFATLLPLNIGDRIIPYLTNFIFDNFPQVRAEAIIVLTNILSNFEPIVEEDCRLLIDFIFPKLKIVTTDSSNLVKSTLASNLAKLAMISLNFLKKGIEKMREDEKETSHQIDYGLSSGSEDYKENEKLLIKTERESLQTVVNELFVILCGSDNDVRQCLFEPTSLDLLCQFFGPNRATDILMHMITVLNDKPDWRMRAIFSESCPVVASHLGQNRSAKLLPFLQQGLQDCQEYVVYQNLCCIYALCDKKLLPKKLICELLHDVVPFLVHPNKWLRVAVVNILVVLQSTFNVSDFYCKVTPLVKKYLKENLIVFNDQKIIYEVLVPPIPRQIWDFIVDFSHASDLTLSEHSNATDKSDKNKKSLSIINPSSTNTITESNSFDETIKNKNLSYDKYFNLKKTDSVLTILSNLKSYNGNEAMLESAMRKLINLGLDETIERKLLDFKNILLKINNFENLLSKKQDYSIIRLENYPEVCRYTYDLETGKHVDENTYSDSHENSTNTIEMQPVEFSIDEFEQKNKCSSLENSISFQIQETLNHKRNQYLEQKRVTTAANNREIAHQIAAAVSDEKAFKIISNPSTVNEKPMSNSPLTSSYLDIAEKSSNSTPRLEIKFLAHIHEHSDKITKLSLHQDKNHFASCSYDKTIKIWSVSALLGNSHPAAFSSNTLRYSHKINSCSFMSTSGNLAIASDDGQLQVFDVQHKRLVKTYRLNVSEEGSIAEMYSFGHVIYALTKQSYIYCFDLRIMPKSSRVGILLEPIWKKEPKNSYGLLTSFCIDDANQHWMFSTGSSATSKNLILWDLRFNGLEITSWSQSTESIIPLRCWPLTRGSQCSEVFTNSTREGEVSLWDLSTQSKTDVLWPSLSKPFSYKNELVTSALTPSCIDPDIVYTGDSEGSLRGWNLRNTERSNYLCGPYRKHLMSSVVANTTTGICYSMLKQRESLLQIHVEDRSKYEIKTRKDTPLQINDYHHDSITDLISIWPDLLVSASRDGAIKLSKSH